MMLDCEANEKLVDLSPQTKKVCFVIRNAFSKAECEEILRQATCTEFRPANDKYPESYRNNERLQVDDSGLADVLFEKVRYLTPEKIETSNKSYVLSGLNERLRYCKYAAGQSFSIHQDGIYFAKPGEESVLTFLLYLNDRNDYEGGETAFFEDQSGTVKVAEYKGRMGDVMIFDHSLWHSGQTVTKNFKYILRSDLIYRVVGQRELNQSHHDGYIWKLINLPGKRIASASRDKSIKIWNESMTLEQTLVSHENSVFDITGSGNYLYSVSRDGFLLIWEEGASGYELIEKIHTDHQSVLSVAVCGESILTCGADGCVSRWDTSGKLIDSKQVSKGWVWKILVVTDDGFLISTSEGEVKYLKLASLETVSEICLEDSVRCLAGNGEFFFVGGESGFVSQLDATSLEVVQCWKIHNGIVRDITIKGSEVITCAEDGKVMGFNLESEMSAEIHMHSNFATSLCWGNGGKLFSSSYTGRIESHET
ncbi:2OG-Fe(II) oxygenase [Hahella ganghwensis]|uniref:2OG-Fe(II) oxygenase n=1 Tax=Hahella ganghwensis TaxID=286420 RepID=UPI00035E34CE|nr:2OG-Fe(II) oxygenase [Hahella ganghwensis]